jgi:hypothetical protein
VGLARDSAEQQDGTVVYASDSGVPTDLAVWVDGTKRPVTGVEWVDSSGTARPVTEWHVGPRSLFEVTITGTNSPVTAGETLDVTADITNTGATTASDTIFLQRAGAIYYTETVSGLASGATTSITLSWDTSSGDAGNYTFEVASSDDSESTSVTVESAGPDIPLSFESWNGFGQSGLSYVENDANEGGRTYVELPSNPDSFYATASQLGFSNGIKKMQFEVKHPGYTDTFGTGSVIGGISSKEDPIDESDDTVTIRDEINNDFQNLSEAVLIVGSNNGRSKIIPDDQLANQWFTISVDVVNGTASADGTTISYTPADSPHDSVVFGGPPVSPSSTSKGNFKISENYTIIEK